MRDEPRQSDGGVRASAAENQSDESVGNSKQTLRLLRLPEVMERVGLKRTAIYQRAKDGQFPKPRSLGPRCSVWVESEVDDWIRSVCTRDK